MALDVQGLTMALDDIFWEILLPAAALAVGTVFAVICFVEKEWWGKPAALLMGGNLAALISVLY